MQKLRTLTAAAMIAAIAAPALAAPSVDQIVGQLRAQGYTEIEVSRTWLGRIRIEAENAKRVREIILNQRTGEILRDFWFLHSEDDEDDDDEGHGLLGHEPEEQEDEGDDDDDEGDEDDS